MQEEEIESLEIPNVNETVKDRDHLCTVKKRENCMR